MKILIDTSHFAYSYFGRFQYHYGNVINKIYKTIQIIENEINQKVENEDLIFCFDEGKSIWRKEIYEDYKSNRNQSKEDKSKEYEHIYGMLEKVHEHFINEDYIVLKYPNIEADDLIAYCSLKYRENAIIISEDRDLLQLPSYIYAFRKKEVMLLEDLYSCSPKEFILAKAIAGDNSDGIVGIFRVGMKTAISVIKKCVKDIDNWENCFNTCKYKVKALERIRENTELIRKNLKLVDLLTYNKQILSQHLEDIENKLNKNVKNIKSI